jgi:hypothetical protein
MCDVPFFYTEKYWFIDENMEVVIGRWLGPFFRNSKNLVNQYFTIGRGPIYARFNLFPHFIVLNIINLGMS